MPSVRAFCFATFWRQSGGNCPATSGVTARRALIGARMDKRKRRGANGQANDYTVATLTTDITDATQARDSYVREAQAKESRLFVLLDGLTTLWNDTGLLELLQAESLDKRPELAGTYNLAAA